MTSEEYSTIKRYMLSQIRQRTPRDTGNLRMRATRSEDLENRTFRIYVDSSGDHKARSMDGRAPYFRYINYKPRFNNGEPNRNYHYWDNAVEAVVADVAAKIGGVVT